MPSGVTTVSTNPATLRGLDYRCRMVRPSRKSIQPAEPTHANKVLVTPYSTIGIPITIIPTNCGTIYAKRRCSNEIFLGVAHSPLLKICWFECFLL